MAIVWNVTQERLPLTRGYIEPDEQRNVDVTQPAEASFISDGALVVVDGSADPPAPTTKTVPVVTTVAFTDPSRQVTLDIPSEATDAELAAAIAAIGGRFRGAYASLSTGAAVKANDVVTNPSGALVSRIADGTISGSYNPASWTALSAGSSGVILPWATGSTYKTGQAVTNGGNTYTANDDHTAGATFAGDQAAHWTALPVAAGMADRSVWSTGTTYARGDLVNWQADKWVCTTAHTAGSDFDTAKWAFMSRSGLGAATFANLMVFGDSWATQWPLSLANEMRLNQSYNGAVAGTVLHEAAHQLGKIAPSQYGSGVMLLASGVNDAAQVSTTQRAASATNALRAWIDLALSTLAGRTQTNSGLASIFYDFTGTWTTTADNTMASAQRKTTTTQNDSVTASFYGDKVTILLLGQADATGATYSVTSAGQTLATGSLSNQTFAANQYVPVRLSGFGPGYHTVKIAKTDAAATLLGFDLVCWPSSNPPTAIITKVPPVAEPTHNTNRAWVNAIIDGVAAEAFTSGQPVYVVDPASGTSWDITYDSDHATGYHLTTRGYSKIWRSVFTKIAQVASYFNGTVQIPTTATNPPQNQKGLSASTPASPLSVSDDFTRADGQAGATSVGGRPWVALAAGDQFAIQSNKLVNLYANGAHQPCVVDNGKSDTTISWTISDPTNLGLVFRGIDYQNFYFWGVTGRIWKNVGGGQTQLTPVTGSATLFNAGDVCSVVLSGNSITLKVNGTTVATYTDASLAGTLHGISATAGTGGKISAFAAT